MNLERLRLLATFAREGTVAATADALNLTPSAVSQQLKTLRREVGAELFVRSGRALSLNELGQLLASRSQEIVAAADRVVLEVAAYRDGLRPSVRVASFPTGAAMFGPALVGNLAARQVVVHLSDPDEPASCAPAQLERYDIVLVHRDERSPLPFGPDVDVVALLREPLDVILPAGHRLSLHQRLRLADLADEPWISVEAGYTVDDIFRTMTVASGVRPVVVQRVNDFRVTEELVAAGHGVALMPRFQPLLRDLPRHELADVPAARMIEAVTRAGAAAQPTVALVLSELVTIAAAIAG